MTRLLVICFIAGALGACVSLPGSETPVSDRYLLQGPTASCQEANRQTINLSVSGLSAGLDNNRVARRDAASGEMTYLKSVNWIAEAGPMMEQRLAADLECAGYTTITSHHRSLGNNQLVCEVRAFNLVSDAAGESAEVALSCLYFRAGDTEGQGLRHSATRTLIDWSASSAITAMSNAYQQVLADLLQDLAAGAG